MQLSVTTNAILKPSLTLSESLTLFCHSCIPMTGAAPAPRRPGHGGAGHGITGPRRTPGCAGQLCSPGHLTMRTDGQFMEVMFFPAGAAVGEILPQRVFTAGKGQFGPRHIRFVVQGDLQALRSRREFRLEHLGAKHDMDLV